MNGYCDQLFTENEIGDGYRQKLDAGHYSKLVPGKVNQFLDSIRYFLQIYEPHNLSTKDQYGTLEESKYIILKVYCKATGIINVISHTERLLQ